MTAGGRAGRDGRASPHGFAASIPDFYPPNGGLTFGIVPLQEQVVGDVRRAVVVLIGVGRASSC